ncbi:hypothetical protein [Absidia glauca]|uniref:Uncharacterized protein n=1 Tax=Absidia glauca TaxID=4829 RepID=A0A168KVA4_ABSGL|nr:hypothetical protein [Absidia glauca]
MKVPYFYLSIAVMALMETVSAQIFKPRFRMIMKDGSVRIATAYFRCYNLVNVKSIYYYFDTECRYYTDTECESPVDGTYIQHVSSEDEELDNPTGSFKCIYR